MRGENAEAEIGHQISYAYEPGVGEIRLSGARISRRDQLPVLSSRKQHGEDAPIHAAMRADAMLEAGDLDGLAI